MNKFHKVIFDAIATRNLHLLNPKGQVAILQIGKPNKVSELEWECSFYISNIGMEDIQFGHGSDSVQALIQAIEGARVFLEKSGVVVTWEGGEEGEAGIPKYIPSIYGKKFTNQLNKLVDNQIEDFARALEKQYLEKQKKEKESP